MVHVLTVAARVGEAFQALGALEGLLAGMQTLVLRQMMLVLECLGAVHALIGSLTCKMAEKEKEHFSCGFLRGSGLIRTHRNARICDAPESSAWRTPYRTDRR